MLHMAGGTGTGTGTTTPPLPQTHVSNIMSTTNLLHNQTQPLHSLFLSPAPTSFFTGSRSMVSFEDVKQLQGGYNSSSNNMSSSSSFLSGYDMDYENGDDGMDDYNFHQPEKKRRLSMDQVQFLEKSFQVENKLEPERKTKLAKDLGLQPRQVAIWFQNRRARWKTKQMEKDYDSLNHTYQTLKTDYDNLLKEKDRLQAQVASLTEKVVVARREDEKELEGKFESTEAHEGAVEKAVVESISEGSKISVGGYCNRQVLEDISSGSRSTTDVLDSSSDGVGVVHSSAAPLLETCESDISSSQDVVDQDMLHNPNNYYMFTKPEQVEEDHHHVNYSVVVDPSQHSCNFGFPEEEDHSLWPWSY